MPSRQEYSAKHSLRGGAYRRSSSLLFRHRQPSVLRQHRRPPV